MSQQIEDESYIRRYLLGELSDEEREQVERRLLANEDYYQRVLVAEDELIYDFVCDELPAEEKTSFRQHVLPVPERREDVKFARALRRYVRETAPHEVEVPAAGGKRPVSWLAPLAAFFQRPAVGFSLAVALLLALALSAWMATQNWKLRNRVAQFQASPTPASSPEDLNEQLALERQRVANLTDELLREHELRAAAEQNLEAAKRQPGQTPAPGATPAPTYVTTVASILLTPGVTRDETGDAVKKVPVPRGARQIPLQLDLAANDYPSYMAVLKTVGGQKELLSRKMLRAHASGGRITVSLSLPAKLLSRGDYQIELSGRTSTGEYEGIDTYNFRVAQ